MSGSKRLLGHGIEQRDDEANTGARHGLKDACRPVRQPVHTRIPGGSAMPGSLEEGAVERAYSLARLCRSVYVDSLSPVNESGDAGVSVSLMPYFCCSLCSSAS